jgi:hypothetical protein
LIRSKSINSDQDDGEDLIKKGRKVWKEVCVEVFHTKQPEQDGRLFAIDEGDEKERSFQR